MLLGEAFQSLPPIKEITDERPNGDSPKLNGISEGEGRVVWFSDAEQYGMLMTKLGPARVHWREINRRGSRRRYLQAGELVAFDELAKPHLTKARDTGFKLEAVRVTIKKEKTQ
jgi:cold shock CspA family protein